MILQIISWYKFFARRMDGLTKTSKPTRNAANTYRHRSTLGRMRHAPAGCVQEENNVGCVEEEKNMGFVEEEKKILRSFLEISCLSRYSVFLPHVLFGRLHYQTVHNSA